MTDEQALISQIHQLPENLKAEVAKYIKNLLEQKALNGEQPKRRRPKAGSMPGKFKMAPNFDDPIEGFEEYM